MGNCFAHECSRRRPSRTRPQVAASTPDLNHPRDCKPATVAEAKRQPPATKGTTTMTATEKKQRKVRFADDVLAGDSEKNNRNNDIDNRDVMRVKMVLTKKEAALLLSILGAGGDQGAALESLLCERQAAAKGSPAREGKAGWKPAALERTAEKASKAERY